MKANELRIGNYIMFGELRHKASHHDIRNLYESELINKVPSGSYQPIPLTEEWRLKCGLEYDKAGKYYTHIGFPSGTYFVTESEWPIHGDFDECTYIRLPKFVHQFQNLYFALTGEELTLKSEL